MPEKSKFVDAYSKATGRKQRVPRRWFDNPVLSKGLSKTPTSKAKEAASASGGSTTQNPPPAGDK